MKTTALIAASLFMTLGTFVPLASANAPGVGVEISRADLATFGSAPACAKPVRFISYVVTTVPTGTHAHADGVYVHAQETRWELWWENTAAGATPCYLTYTRTVHMARLPFAAPEIGAQ